MKSYSKDRLQYEKNKKTYSDDKTIDRRLGVSSDKGIEMQDKRYNRVDFDDQNDRYSDDKERYVDYRKDYRYGSRYDDNDYYKPKSYKSSYDKSSYEKPTKKSTKYADKKQTTVSKYNSDSADSDSTTTAAETKKKSGLRIQVPDLPSGAGFDDAAIVQNINGNRNKNNESLTGRNGAMSQNGNSNGQKKTNSKTKVNKNRNYYVRML